MTAAPQRIDLVRLLEFFVAVADERHFGRAADAIGVSQPPLSQGLKRLERKLGSVLLERGSRGATLTPAGVALLPHARRVLADVRLLLSAADDARAEPVGIVIGVPPQLPVHVVSALVAHARRALPDQRVELVTAPTVTLLQSTLRGDMDAAVVVHPAPVAGLAAGPVVRLPGRLLIAADHPLAQHATVTLEAVARTIPVALTPRHHHPAAHDHLMDIVARHGIRVSQRPADDDRAATLIAASGAAAAMTADLDLSSPSVANLAIDGDPLPLRLRIVRPVDSERTDALDALQNALESA
ncbi:LysR family transcriptional regulator [Mycolicibacterium sp.]|uniref:LysR family transcriptional regulator n=1 Tax=Mycolicibacterium sp. TaxID=2320850 RepID=UPI001A26349B|nr:LysR family transcriptional regulator [Mycolicibacterium sp.]MBJ7336669.1 LysR family transcriptional regulator [Mycolicibacterium sp.]